MNALRTLIKQKNDIQTTLRELPLERQETPALLLEHPADYAAHLANQP